MIDTTNIVKRLFAAEKLRDAIQEELSAVVIHNASFKVGDLVKQKAGEYSRECGPGRVVRVRLSRDHNYRGKPDTFSARGTCLPIKKDGGVAKIGEFDVSEENVVILEAAKEV